MAEPRLGAVFEGVTSTISIDFAGVHENPDYTIHVQVLERGSWVTIGSTKTATEPSSTDTSTYEWHLSVAPAQLDPLRWPQGGLLALRAIGDQDEVLAGFFHDADPCINGETTWRKRANACGGVFPNGTIVVSPGDPGAAANRPRFLDRRGIIDVTETAAYYQTIQAPATLADFRTQFGIDPNTRSVYYNAGDLAVGRNMVCEPQTGGGLACASSNFGAFSGDETIALDGAVAGTGAFATVCMVYQPPLDAPNSVQFMVYNGAGTLVNSAQLDTAGDNTSIPTNCINCHGSAATYDPVTHSLTGASFLPFDSGSITFSTRAGFTQRDQDPGIARLNSLVHASTNVQIRELLDGWYPHDTQNPTQAAWVPDAWDASLMDHEVYLNVIAPTCRGCHVTRNDSLAFNTAASFRDAASMIAGSICDSTTRDMPNAEVPLRRLWAGPARAYLAAYLNITSCNP